MIVTVSGVEYLVLETSIKRRNEMEDGSVHWARVIDETEYHQVVKAASKLKEVH